MDPAHTHSFTYSASGETITAECTATGCTLPPSTQGGTNHVATLTIAAPALTIYGGTGSAEATITDANSIRGTATLQYQTKSGDTYGTATTTAPTNAGTHKASITLGTGDNSATASVEYTIAKADPTATAPTASATYGQTLANVTLTNPEGNTAGAWAFVDAGTTSVGDVGSHTFKANFTPTSANYKTVENVDVTVTVGKAANPATVTDTASVTKGGNTVDLANNVTKNGATGTVSYAFEGDAKGCSLSGSVLTSGNNTGSVKVDVTVAEDGNYNALAAQSITVTISDKGTQTISAENVTVAYGDTDKKVSATTDGNGEISYAVKDGSAEYIDVNASSGALTIKKVGTATVIVTAAETSTYTQATKEVTVTINPKDSSTDPNPKDQNLTYNGQNQTLIVAGSTGDGTMMYALSENADSKPAETDYQYDNSSLPTGKDAKTYYVWYMVKGDANHNDYKADKPIEVSIAKKELTVTADAKSKTVGEADPALTYTVEGLVGSDTVSGALSREAGEAAGTYQITQGTLTAGDNYKITFTPATLTIKEAPAPASTGGGGVYYGGGTVSSQPQAPYSQVIGATATSYGDSSPERIHNIELACEKLNGIILQPGEVFSFNEAVGTLTADAGFEVASVYAGDDATAVMGGGVSQVASALYASSLFGLLETVERSNHEYTVPFAQAGVDADVSNPAEGGGLDLKFRNNRNEPIKIIVTSKVDEAKKMREITI